MLMRIVIYINYNGVLGLLDLLLVLVCHKITNGYRLDLEVFSEGTIIAPF